MVGLCWLKKHDWKIKWSCQNLTWISAMLVGPFFGYPSLEPNIAHSCLMCHVNDWSSEENKPSEWNIITVRCMNCLTLMEEYDNISSWIEICRFLFETPTICIHSPSFSKISRLPYRSIEFFPTLFWVKIFGGMFASRTEATFLRTFSLGKWGLLASCHKIWWNDMNIHTTQKFGRPFFFVKKKLRFHEWETALHLTLHFHWCIFENCRARWIGCGWSATAARVDGIYQER